jgi:nucleoside phosphorylase
MPVPSTCDFAIVTVLPEVRSRVCSVLGLDQDVSRDQRHYWYGQVASRHGGRPHTVVCGRTTDRFNSPASTFTADMIGSWRPRYVVVCDIAGGMSKAGVSLGDVVFHEHLHYFESQKIVPGEIKERFFDFAPSSPVLREWARAVQESQWQQDVAESHPVPENGPPALHEGEIVVGEKVLGDRTNPIVDSVIKRYDNALAVDMESAGVGYAVLHATFKNLFPQFLVVRGISDFFDVDREGGEDNNATRKRFKPYAAGTAAAVLRHLVSETPAVSAASPVPTVEGGFLSDYGGRFQRRLNASLRGAPAQEFLLTFEADDTVPRPTNELIELCEHERRVVLTAQAGAGKSVVLGLLARQLAPQADPLCVVVDLEGFVPPSDGPLTDDNSVDLWLSAILHRSIVDLPLSQLRELVTERRVVILVDGVNEVPRGAADEVVAALDEFAFNNHRARLVVTDRGFGVRYQNGRWYQARLLPISAGDVEGYIDDRFRPGTYAALGDGDEQLAAREKALLGLPFFLAIALERGAPALGSRADAMFEFFTRQVGLPAAALDSLAHAAFAVYVEIGRRTFARSWLTERVGEEIVATLFDGGVLVDRENSEVGFAHQLQHDFLAGRHLATDETLWNPDILDQVSFHAESTDPLAQALAVLDDVPQRDRFLRAVYNWNWYGCVQTMSVVEADGHVSCTPPLRTALLALVAEKRFDPVIDTAAQASSLLDRFTDPLARELASVRTHRTLLRRVPALEEEEAAWFSDWRDLFLSTPPPQAAKPELVERLASPDPVEGWTASNVLRRFRPARDTPAELLGMYLGARTSQQVSRATRWRIVHSLGAWATDASADLLLRALDEDEYIWVKYGAVRSLVEIAATGDDSLRTRVTSDLGDRLAEIPELPLKELAWSASRKDVRSPESWVSTVRPLLVRVRDSQRIESARATWQVRVERFEATWQGHG